MAYPGWLSFAGTEIANVARTVAYTRHSLPSLEVVDTYDSDDLHNLLGDLPYSSPASDDAPWYSPYDPDSADFFGFYPLVVQGLDDASVDVTVTELTGSGAVLSRMREGSKSVRVVGLILGATEASLQSGKRWLRGALAAPDCTTGDCNGAELCYLSFLPQWCDFSDYPDVPVDIADLSTDVDSWTALRGSVVVAGTGSLDFGPRAGSGASRYVSDLVPGEPYRVSFDLSSTSPVVRVEVSGAGTQAFPTTAEGADRGLGLAGPFVVDFIAQQSEHVITVTQDSVASTSLYAMRVARTPERQTVARLTFPSYEVYEPGSWDASGFPGSVTYAGTMVTTPAFGDHLLVRYQTASTTPITVTPTAYLDRRIRGLTPGRRYTVTAAVGAHTNALVALTAQGVSTTVTANATDPNWVTFSFVAQSHTESLLLGFGQTVTTTAASPAMIRLSYLRVDLDDPDYTFTDPDLSESATRTLRQVGIIDGPRVVEGYALTAGAMEKIEFTVSAGPHAYAPLVQIPPDVDGTYAVIPDTACSLGWPVRHNLIVNPSFETNVTGWTPISATLTRVAANPQVGTWSGRITVTGSPSVAGIYTAAAMTVTPGAAYTFSAYVTSSVNTVISMVVGTTSATLGGLGSSLTPVTAGVRTRVDVVATAGTVTTAQASIQVYDADGSGPTTGITVDVDAVQFEAGAFASTYFDGTTSGGTWDGTAHASTSTWATPTTALIVDPDCTPIPPPPRAPLVLDDCIEAPTTWRRYYVTIPAQEVPAWSAAVPIVSLTTGETVVRQIRLRFTAVPFGQRIDQINPCDYCGEFVVSYIPANSTLTIDSILEQASIDVASTGTQTAQNLVYGTDGGPITWPTLSCEVEYVMTVDVSPTIQDLDVRLALARRE